MQIALETIAWETLNMFFAITDISWTKLQIFFAIIVKLCMHAIDFSMKTKPKVFL